MKKVLVTGANGYIGRHVIQQLIEQNVNVFAADIALDKVDGRAHKIKMDIFNYHGDLFKELGEPDVCLHMAWRNGFVHNADTHIEDLSRHFIFIKRMIEGGLRQLAVMGTMHEIGYYEGMVNEDTPCNPISLYGIAKNTLRKSLEIFMKNYDICFQWLRAYYIYGDDKYNHSIFAKLRVAEEEGQKEFPFNSGKNKYDFIHICDLAKQLAACVTQTEITGIINCCSGMPITLAEKVEGFLKEHKYQIKLKYGAFPDRPYDSPGIWGDNQKIKQILVKA